MGYLPTAGTETHRVKTWLEEDLRAVGPAHALSAGNPNTLLTASLFQAAGLTAREKPGHRGVV